MRSLRIAFVSGGAFAHVRPYIDYFRARGHDVHLVAYGRPDRDHGVPTHDISRGASGHHTASKWKYLLAAISARRILRNIRPDIVHGHYVSSAGVICFLSGFRPYVLTAHGSDLLSRGRSRLWRVILRRCLGGAAMVNTVSEQLTDIALELGVAPGKVLLCTFGIDTSRFQLQVPRRRIEPIRILCTRTLAAVYDPLTILQACRLLRDRGVDLRATFAADGPLRVQLQTVAAAWALSERVQFLGGYDPSELPSLLRSHDVYVSASRWDGTSISLLEAMASGAFPVVSRTPSNLAWLTEGETALMFDCGDASNLAKQLFHAAWDHNLRLRAAAANRSVVEERGDRETSMRRVEQMYFSVIDNWKRDREAGSCVPI